MKKNYFIIFGLMSLLTTASLAQASDPQGRDLELNFNKPHQPGKSGRPGLRVRLERKRKGKTEFVSPQTIFQAGDQIRVHFAVNYPSYVAVINQGSTGKVSLLAPWDNKQLRVKKTADYAIPTGTAWFRFDNNAGEEKLTLIVSPKPIKEVTALHKRQSNGGRARDAEELHALIAEEETEGSRDLQLNMVGTSGYAVGSSAAAKTYRIRLTLRHQ